MEEIQPFEQVDVVGGSPCIITDHDVHMDPNGVPFRMPENHSKAFVLDETCLPDWALDSWNANPWVTITLHGPDLSYDAGAGWVTSNQLTLRKNFRSLVTDPVEVFLDPAKLTLLQTTIKIRPVS